MKQFIILTLILSSINAFGKCKQSYEQVDLEINALELDLWAGKNLYLISSEDITIEKFKSWAPLFVFTNLLGKEENIKLVSKSGALPREQILKKKKYYEITEFETDSKYGDRIAKIVTEAFSIDFSGNYKQDTEHLVFVEDIEDDLEVISFCHYNPGPIVF